MGFTTLGRRWMGRGRGLNSHYAGEEMDREKEGTDGKVFGARIGRGSTRLQHCIAFGWLWFSAPLLIHVGWSSRKRDDGEYMKDERPGCTTQRKCFGRSGQGGMGFTTLGRRWMGRGRGLNSHYAGEEKA
ncbi:hypothetical protein T07_4423 [Trichinella nelsoni]|uniref:Uncharacterized protein n=1 Tax=Trichinella nelsoni TaxID=6336 RepID=A0A0V0RH96_9BILA|nr:hypothetical protein T07_4423 [Trichinella nelsoni]